jgi:hypothetical protein
MAENNIMLITSDNIVHEALYMRGEWYGVVAASTAQGPDYFRVILQKTNDSWNIVVWPSIVLSYERHPDIPKSIINDVNRKGLW